MPTNPFQMYRLNRGYSLAQLAQISQISKSTIIKAEQGLYTNPPGSLVQFWLAQKSFDLDYPQILTSYEDYQYSQRALHKRFLGPISRDETITPHHHVHPLRQLRYNPSQFKRPVGIKELCRSLCLPSDNIEFFERKWHRQQSVPKNLLAVLQEIDYSNAEIFCFQQVYHDWRELNLAKRKVQVS